MDEFNKGTPYINIGQRKKLEDKAKNTHRQSTLVINRTSNPQGPNIKIDSKDVNWRSTKTTNQARPHKTTPFIKAIDFKNKDKIGSVILKPDTEESTRYSVKKPKNPFYLENGILNNVK